MATMTSTKNGSTSLVKKVVGANSDNTVKISLRQTAVNPSNMNFLLSSGYK